MPKTTAPLHTDHAVNEVIFSLQLGEQLTVDSIKKITRLKEVLNTELPIFEELKQFTFQINPNKPNANALASALSSTPEGALAGLAFRHGRDDGSIDWNIQVEQNMLVVSCLDYKGWDTTWPKARTYLETIAEQVIDVNCIKAINLQYTNIFLSSAVEPYELCQVFNDESDYLTHNIKNSSSLWHLFQGWFEDDAILKCKCLNNLNVATTVKDQNHITTITLLRQAQKETRTLDSLDDTMNQLHIDLKKILSDVLAQSMARKINLKNK